MNFNSLMKCCLMIALFLILSFKYMASADALAKPNTLIVYSTESGEATPAVHMLDLLAGHFSKQTTIVSDERLAEKRISEFQQVIYLGEIKRTLSKQTIRMMNEAQKIIAIGYNAEQLRPFSKLTFHKQEHTSQIKYTDDLTYRQLEKRIIALTVQGADLQREFLLKKHEADLPFVIQTKEGASYIGILNVVQHNELLAEVLEKHLSSSDQLTTKYLKLGNISPVTDEKKLLELGQYVSTRHIPFLIAVTPVWVDRTTGMK
ncbi:hypothetical protein B33_29720 [Bacillus safensis]|nr:DUF2334 domain-containing protein [Bacillus safensis]GLF84267.1 hypothetical protein B33_29720 [Bacillus safensis]